MIKCPGSHMILMIFMPKRHVRNVKSLELRQCIWFLCCFSFMLFIFCEAFKIWFANKLPMEKMLDSGLGLGKCFLVSPFSGLVSCFSRVGRELFVIFLTGDTYWQSNGCMYSVVSFYHFCAASSNHNWKRQNMYLSNHARTVVGWPVAKNI